MMRELDFWSGAMGRQWADHADDLDEQLESSGNEGLEVLRARPGRRSSTSAAARAGSWRSSAQRSRRADR